MQKEQSVFNEWIPNKIIIALLVVVAMPQMFVLSLFSMNSTFTASFLDIDVDDVQFLFSLGYLMIVIGMFLNTRFLHYFNIRNYCLFMTMLNIVLLYGSTLSKNPEVLLIFRILQGMACLFEGCIVIPLIMARLKTNNARIIAFSIMYSTMLTGDKFATYLVKFAIENYTHNVMVYTVIIFHVFALLIYVFIFNHGRLYPKKPLYQLSIGGIFYMMIALIGGAFTLVYGKRYYWFESSYIITSFSICLIFSGLFLLHQRSANRRIFQFDVLKSERVIVGLILFFCFYILRSSMSNIYQVMNVVWHWEWQYVLKIQFFNVIGSFAGVIAAYYMLIYKMNYKSIFIIGFLTLAVSMLWFSYLFIPDLRVDAIIPPLVIQGLGQGILFTPLLLFIIGSVHPDISSSASHAAVSMRFWTNTIGFSLMQNAILHLTTKHQSYMTRNLDITNEYFQDEWNAIFSKKISGFIYNDAVNLTVRSITTKIYNHALLISNIEIFRTLFVFGLLTIIFILVYGPISRKLINKF